MAKEKVQISSTLRIVFWLMVLVFVFIISMMVIPGIQELVQGPLFLVPYIIFTLLGLLLLFLTIRQKVQGRLKKLLLAVSLSAIGIFFGIVLHNLLYALTEIITRPAILLKLFEGLHVVFFFIAVVVSPLIFIFATIYTMKLISPLAKSKF